MAVGIVEMIYPMLGKPIANGLKVFQMIAKSGILIIEPRTRVGAGSSACAEENSGFDCIRDRTDDLTCKTGDSHEEEDQSDNEL